MNGKSGLAFLSGPGHTPGTGESREPVAVISRRRACAVLGIGERWLRVLIQQGRLVLLGSGQGRQITVSSVEAELSKRKTAHATRVARETTRKSGIPVVTVPLFFTCPIDTVGNDDQTGIVSTRSLEDVQDFGNLLSVASSAASIGISPRALTKMIDDGQLPAVRVGNRFRVSSSVLRAFMRGELRPVPRPQMTGGAR